MIGRLRGTIAERGNDHVVIDVAGVGYVVHCSDRTLAAMPSTGSGVILHTDLLVREDLLQLYGFRSARERDFHRLLTTVQGVGAKAALSIVAALGVDGGLRAVVLKDSNAIRSAQGVGPRIAQRVVSELGDKAAELMAQGGVEPGTLATSEIPGDGAAIADSVEPLPEEGRAASGAEAISAMVNLGYQQGEAARVVAEVHGAYPELDTSGLIREALKRLAPA